MTESWKNPIIQIGLETPSKMNSKMNPCEQSVEFGILNTRQWDAIRNGDLKYLKRRSHHLSETLRAIHRLARLIAYTIQERYIQLKICGGACALIHTCKSEQSHFDICFAPPASPLINDENAKKRQNLDHWWQAGLLHFKMPEWFWKVFLERF